MRLDQEIIDMENFYATASIEEVYAYFKSAMHKATEQFKSACRKVLRAGKGIMARFGKAKPGAQAKPTNKRLRENITDEMLRLNSFKDTFEYTQESEMFLLQMKDILREESKK